MSRSYKRTPVYTVKCRRGGSKLAKKQANRKVRRKKVFYGKSKIYKRAYDSWNIVDYRFYKKKPLSDDVEIIRIWEKSYYRK